MTGQRSEHPELLVEEAVACRDCLRRSWLLALLADHLERNRREGSVLRDVLALSDERLIAALGGDRAPALRRLHARFDADTQREAITAAGLSAICGHDPRFPPLLAEAPDAPACLHVAGSLERFLALAAAPTVALVGARLAGEYGLEVATSLGRGLAAAGVTVVSGLALGVDSAAHAGALQAAGEVEDPRTVAVLAAGPERAYPKSKLHLHRHLVARAAVVSELPPGFSARRWCFPARNRIIAGLAQLTVVVEATDRSGSLITADFARALGRDVGAVPGQVLSSRAAGTNALLFDGAHVVRDTTDILDLLFGAGATRPPAASGGHASPTSSGDHPFATSSDHPASAAGLAPALAELLEGIDRGRTTVAALGRGPQDTPATLAGLAELELLGLVRRGPAGSYVRCAP